ncbi:hypothetical protein D918_03957 [Trichuris suis]|nr:hypothetical protein D918_03957 [Trichuris suis]
MLGWCLCYCLTVPYCMSIDCSIILFFCLQSTCQIAKRSSQPKAVYSSTNKGQEETNFGILNILMSHELSNNSTAHRSQIRSHV